MPRFYFDAAGSGTEPFQDRTGLDFGSLVDARAHAMTLLPVVGVELPLHEGEFRSWTISVRSDDGTVLCRFIVAVVNDDLGPGKSRVLRPV